jgi:predicted Rossmann fold nucleotide-binding protein DprA/Smf involved in DNA uptake
MKKEKNSPLTTEELAIINNLKIHGKMTVEGIFSTTNIPVQRLRKMLVALVLAGTIKVQSGGQVKDQYGTLYSKRLIKYYISKSTYIQKTLFQ